MDSKSPTASAKTTALAPKEDLLSIPKQLSDLLPKAQVSRKEYRRRKKLAKRKLLRQSIGLKRRLAKEATESSIEYKGQQEDLAREYEARKLEWEKKEAEIKANKVRRAQVEQVLKAQLAKSLGHLPADSGVAVPEQDEPSYCPPSPPSIIETNLEQKKPQISREPCILFLKTGVCRLGPECQWLHSECSQPTPVLILPHRFHCLEPLSQGNPTVRVLAAYHEFMRKSIKKFLEFGTLLDLKVGFNMSPHLRGNVYLQYATPMMAKEAHQGLAEFLPRFMDMVNLSPLLCGEFEKYRHCKKGNDCNYLHAFVTPAILDLKQQPPFVKRDGPADSAIISSNPSVSSYTGSRNKDSDSSRRRKRRSPSPSPRHRRRYISRYDDESRSRTHRSSRHY